MKKKKILKQWKPVASLVKNIYTAIENSSAIKNKQNRLMILSSCAVRGKEKKNFYQRWKTFKSLI